MKIKLFAAAFFLILWGGTVIAEDYPKIDISGFKKWEYKDVTVNPQTNKFLGLQHLGGFTPNVTGGPWQERLQLAIAGRLTDKLSVTYDVQQQPESQDKYDVKVNYDNKHELTFGDFSATFAGNEFASTTKFLNGVMVTSKDNNYDFIAVPSAKLKSQVQNLASQRGNNSKGPYSLGHGSIVEGSERVQLNSIPLTRGKDYLIDYFEGKITFTRILTQADEFKYSYEYTNLLDLFFPALSRKDFFGVQGRMTFDPATWGKQAPTPMPKERDFEQFFPAGGKAGKYPEDTPTGEAGTSESVSTNEAPARTQEDIAAEEGAGKFRLKHFPAVQFSETLVFNGMLLKKNEDYAISYDEGLITLLLPVMPSKDNPMQAVYKYHLTSVKTENIPAASGKGPYRLAEPSILPKSEKVYVDGRLVVRDFDYVINGKGNAITFNYTLSNTSLITVSYVYKILELPPQPPPPKYPRSLTLGMTYLKETAKKAGDPSNIDYMENLTGQNIISNDNTIYLKKYPVVPSSEGGNLVVTINDKPATIEVDYAVPTVEVDSSTGYARVIPQTRLAYISDRSDPSDGYRTGTIRILASLEAASRVTVLYTYKKTIVGRHSGIGNGNRGPYYIKNFRNIAPGTERVEVWATGSQVADTYVRNTSFEGEGNAGDKGYSINYDLSNPSITFNKELASTQNFSVYFQYVPPQTAVSNDIAQDLTGFDASFKVADLLQFEGNYGRSSTDQIVNALSTVESFSKFAASATRVTLGNKPVIENSEQVFVNNYLRNKDADYFVDYTSGAITFYYITLTTLDVVTVDYQYQSQTGVQVSSGKKADYAYKYGIKSSLGKISVAYNDKAIGFDFSPLGGTAIGVGSKYRDFSVGLQPLAHSFQTTYSYRETNNPIGATRNFYTKNYDRTYTAGANPFNLMNATFSYRNLEVRGDPSVAGGNATSDNSLNSYSAGLAPIALQRGALIFNQRYDASRTMSEDRIGFTRGRINSGHVNYSLGLTDRLKLSTDFQLSEPLTLRTQTGEARAAWSLSRDLAYDASLDLTFFKLKKLATYAKLLNHEALTFVPAPGSKLTTKNTTYHVDFNPVDALRTNYDYNRQETPSVVVDGKNPKAERTATGISLNPHPAVATSWSHAKDSTINESGRDSSGDSNTYTLNWTPLSREKIKLTSNYSLYGRQAMTPSGTLEVRIRNNTFNQDYTLTLAPIPALAIMPGFSQEEYYYLTSTSPQELRTQNKTVRCKVSFNPVDRLGMDADYNLKVTTSLNDNASRHKTLLSLKTGYKVFSWGELVHTLEEEMNQGEVQAGGVLPDIDYRKTLNTISLNFNIPQENPILSSVTLTASYKLVKFENRKKPSDDLFGSLIAFEGSLNF